jgi:hypothetical protein
MNYYHHYWYHRFGYLDVSVYFLILVCWHWFWASSRLIYCIFWDRSWCLWAFRRRYWVFFIWNICFIGWTCLLFFWNVVIGFWGWFLGIDHIFLTFIRSRCSIIFSISTMIDLMLFYIVFRVGRRLEI